MPMTQSLAHPWTTECDLLQCVDCGGRLEPSGDARLVCADCFRNYPIEEGVLNTLRSLVGNNKVAADFYNGPLWPRFRFWDWLTFFVNGGERRARKEILQHLPPLSGTKLLEVAIGDGGNMPFFPEDCHVYGNDISPVQLEQGAPRFAGRNVRLVLGEAEKLPFRDRSFDNVLSLGAFNYFNDPQQALREMARVVKPGGRIVVADELPNLANRMLFGRWIGLRWLDRWFLAKLMHLGPDFSAMVDRHRDMKLEPIAKEVLAEGYTIHSIWSRIGYCIVGQPRA